MEYKSFFDIINWLVTEHGYKEFKEDYEYPYVYKSLLEKRIENESVCETNNKLYIHIRVAVFEGTNGLFTVEIVAEKKSLWWNLSCYSLNSKEIQDNIEEVEQTLVKLFNSIDLPKKGIHSPDEYFD